MWFTTLYVVGVFTIVNPGADCTVDGPSKSADIQVKATPEAELLMNWLGQRGYQLDVTAYAGLPSRVLEQDLGYLKAAVEIVGGKNRTTRDSYKLLNREKRAPRRPLESHPGAFRSGGIYPFDTWVEEAGEEAVPVQLLPNPAVVRELLLKSRDGKRKTVQEFVEAGAPYNRTIIFVPGPDSEDPEYPLNPEQPYFFSSLELGKIVGRDVEVAMPLERLQAGQPDGARVVATMTAVEISDALYFVQIDRDDRSDSLVAFPIAQGHSGFRERSAQEGRVAPFANRVTSPQDDSIAGHTLVLVPRPLVRSVSPSETPWFVEDVVVFETHAGRVPPIVVLRKDETWEPYREDYVLATSFNPVKDDEHSVRRIGVFMNIEPQDLLQVVASLHGCDSNELDVDESSFEKLRRLRTPQNGEEEEG